MAVRLPLPPSGLLVNSSYLSDYSRRVSASRFVSLARPSCSPFVLLPRRSSSSSLAPSLRLVGLEEFHGFRGTHCDSFGPRGTRRNSMRVTRKTQEDGCPAGSTISESKFLALIGDGLIKITERGLGRDDGNILSM